MPTDHGWPVGIAAAEIEIAAGVDREVLERLQLARGGVDRQALRDRAEIERAAAG